MRSTSTFLLAVSVLTGCAAAQPAPTQLPSSPPTQPVAPTPAPTSIDDALYRLDKLGKSLNNFTADVSTATVDPDSGADTTRKGKVWYQVGGDGDARIRVTFDTRDVGNRRYKEKIEYLLEKGVLTDRNYETKAENKRVVLKPGEKANLLKLGEGPFPLPIGQDKAEVYKLFDVTQVASTPDDPAGTTHLKLVPKPNTQFAPKFASIDVWVDPKTDFPVRIDTVDANNTGTRETKLTNVTVNTNLTDAQFTLPQVEGWNLRTEEYSD
jgi:outer membrane lipoprotein-sorting protein